MALEAARSRWEVMQADPTSQNLATIAAQAQVLEDRRTEYLTSAATLGLSELACPTCGLELTDHGRTERAAHLQTWLTHTYAQDYEALRLRRLTGEKEKSRWQREREELRQRVSQLDQQRKQAEETAAHRAGDEQRHRESVAALNATAARCEALGVPLPFDHVRERKIQDELVRLASEIDQLQSQKVLYDRREEYVGGVAETKQKLCDQDRTIENLESGRTTLAYDAAAHQQAKDAHRGATVMSQEAVLHVERQTTVLRDVQQELRRIDVAHAEAIAAARTLDDAVLALRREALLVTKLTAFQQHFFAVNTWEVVQRASALVQTIVDSSIRGLVLERGGHLLYRDAGYVKRDVSRLSGGEKALVGLCLRLALAERAQRIAGSQQVRFLVLDEVLSSLDDHRRDQVQHVLHEVLRNGLFEHIIMITHIDDIKKNWRAHRLDVTKVDEDISRADMVYLPTGI